jgi:hypothetical protein
MPHSMRGRHIANQLLAEIGPVFVLRRLEVEMTNRPTGFLRVVFAGVIAFTSIAILPLNAEAAPGECLTARPKTAAPPGQFWLHLSDWTTNRHCWVLRARIETTSQAKGAIAAQAARAATRAAGAPPARVPQEATSNEATTRTDSPQLLKDDGKAVSGSDAALERADQSLSYAEHSDTTKLPPLTSGVPEATDSRSPAGAPPSTIAFAVRTQDVRPQEMNRPINPAADRHRNIEANSTPAPSVTETTTRTREIEASRFLELLLSAIFFGPALYLLAARAIRRVAEPPPHPSLGDASAERALLPPPLEPRENAAAS